MSAHPITSRRWFLVRGLAACSAVLAGRSVFSDLSAQAVADTASRSSPAPKAPRSADAGPPSSPATLRVVEHRADPRRPSTGLDAISSRDYVYAAFTSLVDDPDAPLDALAALVPEEGVFTVLVDARHGLPATRGLAEALAKSLADLGSPSVKILDANDADMGAAGYRVVRAAETVLTHGTDPQPGYGAPVPISGSRRRVRFSRAIEGASMRLAVVARLFAEEGKMGPFVLDAALRGVDEASRAAARSDPAFGARLLADRRLSRRIDLVIGDLTEVRLGQRRGSSSVDRSGGAASPSAEAAGSSSDVWTAAEMLAGRNVFAVEAVGHCILSNTLASRGLSAPRPHPLLRAAQAAGIPGARLDDVDWRKALA